VDGQSCEHTSRAEDPFIQPTDFGPSEPPLSVPHPAPPPVSPVLPLVPPPATALNPPAPPTFHQPQKFAGVSKVPSVITHTASATLTHDASATTFSQSQGLVITTHHPAPSAAPCGLALSPVPRPPQPRLTFVHPKPVSLTGGRPKQPHKIVPAPKPEPVSLVLKNTCIAPGEPGGGTRLA
uniref:MLX interacting protein n=1 Tax=Macaca nemestrina TaxID=9545 RepID=A0A2K6DIK8_MACNE